MALECYFSCAGSVQEWTSALLLKIPTSDLAVSKDDLHIFMLFLVKLNATEYSTARIQKCNCWLQIQRVGEITQTCSRKGGKVVDFLGFFTLNLIPEVSAYDAVLNIKIQIKEKSSSYYVIVMKPLKTWVTHEVLNQKMWRSNACYSSNIPWL